MAGARGEAFLRVGEDEVAILFTNRALAEGERVLGRPIGQWGSSLGVEDVIKLARIGLNAARRESRPSEHAYTVDDVWTISNEVGLGALSTALGEAVKTVVNWQGEDGPDGPTTNKDPLGPRPGTGGSS